MAKPADWRSRAAQDQRRIKYLATEFTAWLTEARATRWERARYHAKRCANTLARIHDPGIHRRAQTLGWGVHTEAQRLAAMQVAPGVLAPDVANAKPEHVLPAALVPLEDRQSA